MELRGKVAVVTGGASGIGAACCRAFAAEGARVVVADREPGGAESIADEIGGLAVVGDIGREADVAELVRRTEAEIGPVDVFFSNAGIGTGGDPIETPLSEWQEQWDVNVMAHVYAVRAVLPGMLQRGSGYLLHTASMAGILTTIGNCTYAVTKHAVVGLAEWLSISYHDQGIRVSLLAPLGVNTPMLRGLGSGGPGNESVGPVKEPDEVARMVVDAIGTEQFLILTDPLAATWMQRKSDDLERWLTGMRRLAARTEADG